MAEDKERKEIRMNIFVLFCLIIAGGCQTLPPEKKNEAWYQKKWCAGHGGRIEVIMPDKTRCDCVTFRYAVEVEFARKWAEAITQTLHYARLTGKRPGIVFICRRQSDLINIARAVDNIKFYKLGIKIWRIGCEKES